MPIKKKAAAPKPQSFEVKPVGELPLIMAALIYGRSGTGKTTAASTFPKPLLILDIRERGTDSIANVKGVDVVEIEKWEQIEDVYWFLKKGNSKYKSVCIDQLTQMQNLALNKCMRDEGKDEDEQISRRIFGAASGLMKQWLMNYRDLIDESINVVFLAHDRQTDGEEGDGDQIEPSVGPRLMPSVASDLNGMVKMIGNTYISEKFSIQNKRRVRDVQYSMRLGPHAFYTTKARSPVGIATPDSIVDPTYDKLVAVMAGDYSEKTTTVKKKGK